MSSGLHRIEFEGPPGERRVHRRWADAAIAAALGVDPTREVLAQRLAAAAGIAPAVLDFDPLGRSMCMEFVAGERLEVDWLRRTDRRAAMADLLARLRRLSPADLPTLDLATRVRALHDEWTRRAPGQAAEFDATVTAVLDESASAGVLELPARGSMCLVHGDLTPTNVLVRGDGSLMLIDWEYAHAGHPLEDLAGLVAELSATGPDLPDLALLLQGFPGVTDRSLAVRVRLRRLLDVLWKAVASTYAGVREGR